MSAAPPTQVLTARVPAVDAQAFREQVRRRALTPSLAIGALIRGALAVEAAGAVDATQDEGSE